MNEFESLKTILEVNMYEPVFASLCTFGKQDTDAFLKRDTKDMFEQWESEE